MNIEMNDKLYVVARIENDDDSYSIMGVCSSRAEAQNFIHRLNERDAEDDYEVEYEIIHTHWEK